MILGVLKLFLTLLPGPVFEYLKSRNVLEMAVIKAETERRRLQQEIILKENDHWIAWLPRFLIGFSVAVYVASVFFVSVFWELGLEIKEVPDLFKEVMLMVIGGLFLEKITRIFIRR